MIKKNTTEIGKWGETVAVKYLKKNGYKILHRNKHESHNEIDIIAQNSHYIVFVEVKTRSSEQDLYLSYGSPASAVDRKKQMRLIMAAKDYLSAQKYHKKQPRMDVIEVYLEQNTEKVLKINHIINAFGA